MGKRDEIAPRRKDDPLLAEQGARAAKRRASAAPIGALGPCIQRCILLAATVDDRELWACALQVERQHGHDAPRFIAERIGGLAIAGDEEGIKAIR